MHPFPVILGNSHNFTLHIICKLSPLITVKKIFNFLYNIIISIIKFRNRKLHLSIILARG